MRHFLVVVKTDQVVNTHALYLLGGTALTPQAIGLLMNELLHDDVVQQAHWHDLDAFAIDSAPANGCVLEVAYRPGVTDNEAESLLAAAHRLGVLELEVARTLRRHLLPFAATSVEAQAAARTLANDLIEMTLCYGAGNGASIAVPFYRELLAVPIAQPMRVQFVALREASDEELLRISSAGVLALDLPEMRAVQLFYRELGRDPTDGELETIAQTWSEHCSHKTFKAKVRYRNADAGRWPMDDSALPPSLYAAYHQIEQPECKIDSLIRSFLMRATNDVLASHCEVEATVGSRLEVLSAFVDNAGIVAFGAAHELSFKVETHNHPSALEPFGGANTGVGGVVRDVLGVSGRPIANTDVLCFGPPDLPADALPEGVLHPQRIAEGVVAGVRDYGNKLGIPTVNGAVLYDAGYIANPLVFCGTLGLAPRGSNPHQLQPGHLVVVLGGRTGRDGIHGATFSSEELAATTAQEVGSAVQIGDPITEKKLLDVLLMARDRQLYSAITDCGAGGLSSAVGEMGAETGVEVDLASVPLKYTGLQPWEIWLSEAQERMVLAVPPEHSAAFLALCASEDVEATVIGRFSGDGQLRVRYGNMMLVDMPTSFLFDGRPQRVLEAVWASQDEGRKTNDEALLSAASVLRPSSFVEVLLALLAHPNIASKEGIVRSYDHEVGGRTVVKPLVGVAGDGPGNGSVLQPLRSSYEGVALGCGINPRYGQIDPYWMALACVDEALRNVVAMGGNPTRAAILDNFCWGDPRLPDRMAGLVRAAAGCYDAAVAYGTPFISGKDSLNNEWRLPSGERRPIPPTLLISALAVVGDVRQCVTMDIKQPDSLIYLVGETRAELGGAHVWDCRLQIADLGLEPAGGAVDAGNLQSAIQNLQLAVPKVDLVMAPRVLQAVHQAITAGLVRACHDLSEGGLAVAAAEMAFAGGLGMELQLEAVLLGHSVFSIQHSAFIKLFSESPTRLLLEVAPQQAGAFEQMLAGLPYACIGNTTHEQELRICDAEMEVLRVALKALRVAAKGNV